jgi:hypothetical protein
LKLSFLANYIHTMVTFRLNYYRRAHKTRLGFLTLTFLIARDPLYIVVARADAMATSGRREFLLELVIV